MIHSDTHIPLQQKSFFEQMDSMPLGEVQKSIMTEPGAYREADNFILLVLQVTLENLILLPTKSTFNCSPTSEITIFAYPSRSEVSFKQEIETTNAVVVMHSEWAKMVEGYLQMSTTEYAVCHVTPDATSTHLSFSGSWSAPVVYCQSSMRTVGRSPCSTRVN